MPTIKTSDGERVEISDLALEKIERHLPKPRTRTAFNSVFYLTPDKDGAQLPPERRDWQPQLQIYHPLITDPVARVIFSDGNPGEIIHSALVSRNPVTGRKIHW
jgi:hypothetical protein